jgi:MFS transporter, SP family, inositol transporter
VVPLASRMRTVRDPGRAVARLVLVAGAASLLDSAAIISVGSALPLWRTEFDLDPVRVGAVSSIMTIGIALGALVGGPVADRMGHRRVFTATVLLYAVGAAVVGTAWSASVLIVGAALLGLGSGANLPASIALVAGRVPWTVRGRMVAATHVMWTVGIVLASAAAFAVSPWGLTGMRGVFLALACIALVALAGRRQTTSALHRGNHAQQEREGGGDPSLGTATTGRTRLLVLIALFYVVYTLVANTFGSFRTYLLVVVGGADQTWATGISFGVTVLGLMGTVTFSAIADSPWRRRVYPIAAVLLVASQALLALTVGGSLAITCVALVLYALAYPYVGEGLYKVWAQEAAAPHQRATFQGGTIAAARAAAALFALVTPALMAREPQLLFGILAAAALAAVLLGRAVMRAGAGGPSPING